MKGGKRKNSGRKKKGWIKFTSSLSPEAYEMIGKIKPEGEQINSFFDRIIKKEAKELDIGITKE